MAGLHPVPRGHSIVSNRKAREWLENRPQVQRFIEKESKEMNTAIERLLERDKDLNQSLDKHLEEHDNRELWRREMRHKCWTQEVYLPVKKSVLPCISGQELNKKARLRQDEFLAHCNKKGHVLMQEYNPLVHRQSKQVSTGPLRDPLNQRAHKRVEEEQVIQLCETGKMYSRKEIQDQQKLPPITRGHGNVPGYIERQKIGVNMRKRTSSTGYGRALFPQIRHKGSVDAMGPDTKYKNTPEDKGGGLVIQDTEGNIEDACRILDDKRYYKRLAGDPAISEFFLQFYSEFLPQFLNPEAVPFSIENSFTFTFFRARLTFEK
ncbi:protein FAM228B-like [Rhinophrynus dorsalis]